MNNTYFPFFINIKDKIVTVIGGGNVALRRVKTLVAYSADIKVVSPKFHSGFDVLKDKVKLVERNYKIGDIDNSFLVIAATDNREINHKIFVEAYKKCMFISVSDCKEECNFFFPAVFENEKISGGLISVNGTNHKAVKKFASDIRNLFDL